MIAVFFRRWLDVFRDAFRVWWLAPVIPLIAIVPEFVQHVVEIKLGMFTSREIAREVGNGSTRWAFGYAKLTGYLIAILLSAHFWGARREGLRWYDPRGVAWKVFGIAVVLFVGTSLLGWGIGKALDLEGTTAGQVFEIDFSIATLPVSVLLVAGLVGDRRATIGSVYRHGWMQALRIVLYSASVLVPLMALHSLDHKLAMGAQPALVWLLMVWDSLVVGLLATAWGTAIGHGYRPLDVDPEESAIVGEPA